MKAFFNYLAITYLLFASAFIAEAKIITITEVGEYVMGDGETPAIAVKRAIEYGRRQAAEKVAVYVKGATKVKNGQITKDDIEVVSVALMKDKTTPEIQRTLTSEGQMHIRAKVTVSIDTNEISKLLAKVREDYQYKERYMVLNMKYAQLQKEIEDLKVSYRHEKDGSKKRQLEERLNKNEKEFTAVEFNRKGVEAAKNEQYSDAIKFYTQAIKCDPNFTKAYNNRAAVYVKLHQYSDALIELNKALKLDHDDYEYYLGRALVYRQLSQYDKALADCTEALRLNPFAARVYCERGFVYVNLKKYKQALDDFCKAVDMDPQDAKAYNNRGNVYFEMKMYGKAIADYTQAILKDASDVRYYFNRGVCYNSIKEFRNALSDYNKCIEISPNDPEMYMYRAYVFLNLDNKKAARKDLEKVLVLDPYGKLAEIAKKSLSYCK